MQNNGLYGCNYGVRAIILHTFGVWVVDFRYVFSRIHTLATVAGRQRACRYTWRSIGAESPTWNHKYHSVMAF